jgi:peptidoglycan/LPS O-acetylase OafA/YrhL
MQATELSPTPQAVHPSIPSAGTNVGDRIPGLDGVRGFAIILVLLWHYVAMPLTHQPGGGLNFVRQILGVCWSGVDLFFVLSGFLLGGILIENRNSPNYFRTFYLRRASRIFPLYYAWLFAVVCAGYFLGSGKLFPVFAGFGSFWPFFTYTQNITQVLVPNTEGGAVLGVTWSLAVEEQFYLILPFIIYFVTPKFRYAETVAGLFVAVHCF